MFMENKTTEFKREYVDDIKKTKSFYVHHLVYEAYIGERPKDRSKVVDHIDNHPWNNYYKNLQLITYKENKKTPYNATIDDLLSEEWCKIGE